MSSQLLHKIHGIWRLINNSSTHIHACNVYRVMKGACKRNTDFKEGSTGLLKALPGNKGSARVLDSPKGSQKVEKAIKGSTRVPEGPKEPLRVKKGAHVAKITLGQDWFKQSFFWVSIFVRVQVSLDVTWCAQKAWPRGTLVLGSSIYFSPDCEDACCLFLSLSTWWYSK